MSESTGDASIPHAAREDSAPAGGANGTRDASTPAAPAEPHYECVSPGRFEPERHYYARVLNAQIHSMVRFFVGMGTDRIIARYRHLNPRVDVDALREILSTPPRFFRWSGADLFHVTTDQGKSHMVVIETNSCPSGQKSMPLFEEHDEQGGYRQLVDRVFLPTMRSRRLPAGDLAVLYDKNVMECSGYAAALADASGEAVHLVEHRDGARNPRARFDDGVLVIRDAADEWKPIRAAFRYVTQRPWNRIPLATKTMIFNPVIACLAGGRNKAIAAKAYDLYNADLEASGLAIRTPDTIWDVHKNEIPLWVRRLGGHAVVKVPYSNAGQGVYTITSKDELDAFMGLTHHYDRFIVQSLVGNHEWSSSGPAGRLFHVGTIPDKAGQTFAADLRMMIFATAEGWRPLALYGRRARRPLTDRLDGAPSWDVLGTNLSVRLADGSFTTEPERLLLMDRKDYNGLGLGLDSLIEAFVQTVLATVAVDRMAAQLTGSKGQFKIKLFSSLNEDPALIGEITDRGNAPLAP